MSGYTGATSSTQLPAFNGERIDPLTAAFHLGNGYRAYSPTLLRFVAPDNASPFGAGGINAYVYCAHDPINNVDPSGHGLFLDMLIGGIRRLFQCGVAEETASGFTSDVTTGSIGTSMGENVKKATGIPQTVQYSSESEISNRIDQGRLIDEGTQVDYADIALGELSPPGTDQSWRLNQFMSFGSESMSRSDFALYIYDHSGYAPHFGHSDQLYLLLHGGPGRFNTFFKFKFSYPIGAPSRWRFQKYAHVAPKDLSEHLKNVWGLDLTGSPEDQRILNIFACYMTPEIAQELANQFNRPIRAVTMGKPIAAPSLFHSASIGPWSIDAAYSDPATPKRKKKVRYGHDIMTLYRPHAY